MPDYDVIIVGGGPAGLSAALVLGRSRRSVLICDDGRPRNRASRSMHGFLTRDGIAPREILRISRKEVAGYGVRFLGSTVTKAQCNEKGVEVVLEDGRVLTGRKLLLATGVRDVIPSIAGIDKFYGTCVHHCPYCDGFEWRDRPLVAYGDPKAACGLALSLLTWSANVTVCTDGKGMPGQRDRGELRRLGVAIRPEKIARLEGARQRLKQVCFESGPPHRCEAMFFNTGQAQRSPLAEKLGCRFDKDGHVCTDRRGRTGVCNLFLAGDANGDVQFVIVAAAEGAQAAVAINRELQKEDRNAKLSERSRHTRTILGKVRKRDGLSREHGRHRGARRKR